MDIRDGSTAVCYSSTPSNLFANNSSTFLSNHSGTTNNSATTDLNPAARVDRIKNAIADINIDIKGLDLPKKFYDVVHHTTKSWKGVEEVISDLIDRVPKKMKGEDEALLKWVGFINSTAKLVKCITPLPLYYQLAVIRVLENRFGKINDELKALKIENCAHQSIADLQDEVEKIHLTLIKTKSEVSNKAVKGSISSLKSISSYLKVFELAGVSIAKVFKNILDGCTEAWSIIRFNRNLCLQQRRIVQLQPIKIDSNDPVVRASNLFINELENCSDMTSLTEKLASRQLNAPDFVTDIHIWKKEIKTPEYRRTLMIYLQNHFNGGERPVVHTVEMMNLAYEEAKDEYIQLAGISSKASVDVEWTKAQMLKQLLKDRVLNKNLLERGTILCQKWESICLLVVAAIQTVLPYISAYAVVQAMIVPLIVEYSFAGAFLLGWLFPALLASFAGVGIFLGIASVLAYLKPNQYGLATLLPRIKNWIESTHSDVSEFLNWMKRLIVVVISEFVNKMSSVLFDYEPHFLEQLLAQLNQESIDISDARDARDIAFGDFMKPYLLKDMGMSITELAEIKSTFESLKVDLLPSTFKDFLKGEFDIEISEQNKNSCWDKIEGLILASSDELLKFYWLQHWKEQAAAG